LGLFFLAVSLCSDTPGEAESERAATGFFAFLGTIIFPFRGRRPVGTNAEYGLRYRISQPF